MKHFFPSPDPSLSSDIDSSQGIMTRLNGPGCCYEFVTHGLTAQQRRNLRFQDPLTIHQGLNPAQKQALPQSTINFWNAAHPGQVLPPYPPAARLPTRTGNRLYGKILKCNFIWDRNIFWKFFLLKIFHFQLKFFFQ